MSRRPFIQAIIMLLPASPALADDATTAPIEPEAPAAATDTAAPVSEVSGASDIEDVGMEDLLDMDLGDQLGTTESASRVKESVLQAPATLTTIDHERIRQSGATTIPDLLREVPGVQVYRTAAGNYIVSLRGMGGLAGNNVIVLVDGVVMNSPLDASVDWDLVPLDPADIDRIEVVAGPVSTIYGANAYTGVINIISRRVIGESPSWAVHARNGIDTGLGWTGGLAGRYLYHQGRTEANVFGAFTYDSLANEADGETPALKGGGVAFRYQRQLSRSTSLELSGGGAMASRSSLDHLVLESVPQRKGIALAGAKLVTSGLPSIFDGVTLWVQDVAHQTSTDDEMYDGFSYADTASNRTVAGLDVTFDFAQGFSGKLSSQASLDWVEAPYIHPNENSEARLGAGFGGGLKLQPFKGLDLSAEARGDSSAMTGKLEFSYRANAVYFRDRWAIRITGASAYRAPSWVEVGGRFSDQMSGLILLEGDPNIQSPRNTSVEATATISPNYDLTLRATGYYSRFTNVIVEDFEPLVRKTFRNSPAPRELAGAEVDGKLRLRENLWLHASGSLLLWIEGGDEVATVATPEQNSTAVVTIGLRGASKSERFSFGLDATMATSRDYAVIAGIPPEIINRTVPTSFLVTAMAEYRVWPEHLLWASARLVSGLPYEVVESPLPNATANSPGLIIGLELRTE